jgi:hypothetical protein
VRRDCGIESQQALAAGRTFRLRTCPKLVFLRYLAVGRKCPVLVKRTPTMNEEGINEEGILAETSPINAGFTTSPCTPCVRSSVHRTGANSWAVRSKSRELRAPDLNLQETVQVHWAKQ